jgi:hypothetical protein
MRRHIPSIFTLVFLTGKAKAHCPLCTVGVGMISGVAATFGINEMSIGVFVGAFALAMGLWISNLLRFEGWRRWILVLSSFALTVFPLTTIMGDLLPLYIHVAGDYGSLLNRTYLVNLFSVGSVIGAVITLVSPEISWRIAFKRGKAIKHQGVFVTIFLLLLVSGAIHVILNV